MAKELVDRRDQEFIIHEVLDFASLSKSEQFAEFNKKTIDMVVAEGRNLAVKEMLPAQAEGDSVGCKLENGQVKSPECYRKPYELLCEGEWLALTDDPKYGGQGMPKAISMAVSEMFIAANCSFMMYPGLTHGAGKMIETLGTEEQKDGYLRQMYTGKWGGTMCLTEPEAGSDVGALTSTAVKNDDGTYTITGNKIFISSGDTDLVENTIHAVLARIEGAPAGTKGISLFLVPKIRVNEDGSLGEPNDVLCTGIEEKMGIHGSSTCSLAFGGKGNCIGTLLGEENKGMKAMFLMMNEARLLVGLQGSSMASASYINAVNYTKERIQGINLLEIFSEDPKPVTIVNHPDIRNQLLFMKSHVEGMRSLMFYTGLLFDKVTIAETEEERERYQGLIDILIPIVKSYCTEKGFDVCTVGVQAYGGYGYIQEYPQEQLLRDCKITKIYEGTNGIQAMDLLGRKLGVNKGKPFIDLLGEMGNAVTLSRDYPELSKMTEKVDLAVKKLGDVAMHIGMSAMSEKALDAFGSASLFLEATGDTCMAWHLLWRASVAAEKLKKAKKKDISFYTGQIKTAEYFMQMKLPVTMGKFDAIKELSPAVMEMPADAF